MGCMHLVQYCIRERFTPSSAPSAHRRRPPGPSPAAMAPSNLQTTSHFSGGGMLAMADEAQAQLESRFAARRVEFQIAERELQAKDDTY